MKCEEVRIKLSEYLDGGLSPAERKHVDEHLRGCEVCRGALAELRGTVNHLISIGEVEPPAWFTQKVMRRVKEEADGEKGLLHRMFFPLRVKLPLEALAVALVAVAAVYVFNVIKPEVRMKLTTAPVAEAPVSEETGGGAADLRGEAKEAIPSEQKVLRSGNEAEGRNEALEKSAEPVLRAKKFETAPEKAYAPPAPVVGESAATATKGNAEMDRDKGLFFDESYSATAAKRKADEGRAELKISLTVTDVIEARAAVEEAIRKAGGIITKDETTKENVVVAEVVTAKIADLRRELEAIGKVDSGTQVLPGDYSFVRIEIRENH